MHSDRQSELLANKPDSLNKSSVRGPAFIPFH